MAQYIGVDPGASGGLCLIYQDKYSLVSLVPMPPTVRDIWNWFDRINLHFDCFAVLEKVQGYIGTAHPGTAMFKFGASFGMLQMALTAAGVPYEEVTPQKWQRGLGIPHRRKEETKGQFKNRLKAHAQRLYPNLPVTLKTCDCLLVAEYCRRTHV